MTTRVAGSSAPEALVEAAAAVFARMGYERASIRTIAKAAGVNLAAVNYHFGSKRALYEATLASKLRPVATATCRSVAADPAAQAHPLEGLVDMLNRLFDRLRMDSDAGSLFLNEIAGPHPASEITREVVREIGQDLTQWVVAGQSSGVVREGSPALLAMSALAQPLFFVLAEQRLGSAGPWHRRDVQAISVVVDHMERYVRAALEAQE